MQRKTHPFAKKGQVLIHPPPISPLQSFRTPTAQPTSSSDTIISPAVLLAIVILAIIFFFCGFLHLLVRFLAKRPSTRSVVSLSRRFSRSSNSGALQRQLQQLFRLHDSGLDQHIIDSLPVFCYKKILGLKEPFDCAVCLCEFADQDRLRLLPNCSHAFHISCIDTWLLSNSTCPLCRNSLENQLFPGTDHYSRELSSSGQSNDGGSVYSVRLGKFRSSGLTDNEEISSRSLDARRCYSMGACEYVIGDSDLMVPLGDLKMRTQSGDSMDDGDVEAKRISNSSKGESFSVSKIWQWSKKGRFTTSSLHTSSQLANKVEAVQE